MGPSVHSKNFAPSFFFSYLELHSYAELLQSVMDV